jgi:predicted esterase
LKKSKELTPDKYTKMQQKYKAVGGLMAMSVFQPAWLPPLTQAKDRRFYLFHSPDDQVCPHWMAKAADKSLTEAGAKTTLVEYEGGHGWHGDIFGNIRRGIEWLEQPQD